MPVYHHQSQNGDREESRDGIGHGIYKHLMNGVSHMLPFVIGGGILIALAFLLDDYQIDPANFGMNTPLFLRPSAVRPLDLCCRFCPAILP